jgi:hypothetical protein
LATNQLAAITDNCNQCVTSTTTKNSDEAFTINQSPSPSLTAAQPPALARPLTHSYQQANSPNNLLSAQRGHRSSKQDWQTCNQCASTHAKRPHHSRHCRIVPNQHSQIHGDRIHTIFTSNQVNIYDQHNTVITVLQAAIIRGWCEPNGLYRIPLVPVVRKNNTNMVLVRQPLSKFLPVRPPPEEAVFNVYKLKTQPELV